MRREYIRSLISDPDKLQQVIVRRAIESLDAKEAAEAAAKAANEAHFSRLNSLYGTPPHRRRSEAAPARSPAYVAASDPGFAAPTYNPKFAEVAAAAAPAAEAKRKANEAAAAAAEKQVRKAYEESVAAANAVAAKEAKRKANAANAEAAEKARLDADPVAAAAAAEEAIYYLPPSGNAPLLAQIAADEAPAAEARRKAYEKAVAAENAERTYNAHVPIARRITGAAPTAAPTAVTKTFNKTQKVHEAAASLPKTPSPHDGISGPFFRRNSRKHKSSRSTRRIRSRKTRHSRRQTRHSRRQTRRS